jgi:hypothetical protein
MVIDELAVDFGQILFTQKTVSVISGHENGQGLTDDNMNQCFCRSA